MKINVNVNVIVNVNLLACDTRNASDPALHVPAAESGWSNIQYFNLVKNVHIYYILYKLST